MRAAALRCTGKSAFSSRAIVLCVEYGIWNIGFATQLLGTGLCKSLCKSVTPPTPARNEIAT
jgi:ABC-type uncharacterized transport system permease subunit